jgi:signal transduction histidine kinase
MPGSVPPGALEEYARSIVDTIRQPLVVLNGELRVESVNPAFLLAFQVSREETLGRFIYDLGNGQWDSPPLRRVLEEILPRDSHFDDFEVTHDFPYIGVRQVLLNARRMHLGDRDTPWILLAMEDVTDRRRAEAQIRHYTERLERSNRELELFASIASHDLQEPLRKIRSFGDLLQRRHAASLPEEAQHYVEVMGRSAKRMQDLIGSLLAYSRVEARGEAFVPVSLADAAREAAADLEVRLAETGGSIEVEEAPHVEADPAQLRQLLLNLFGNALKFHQPGVPPRVRVRVRRLLDPGSEAPARVELAVSDNGIGIEEKYLDRIFRPFERLHTRQAYEGTGMGLAICRRIVERHGGTLAVRSVPGEGSTFIFTLPAATRKEGPRV